MAAIECRTIGIPMREGTKLDAEGWHVFSLDEAKHSPFDVLLRLMQKLGAPEGNDDRYRAMRAKRAALDAEEAKRAARAR